MTSHTQQELTRLVINQITKTYDGDIHNETSPAGILALFHDTAYDSQNQAFMNFMATVGLNWESSYLACELITDVTYHFYITYEQDYVS